jgi:UDP-N-acetylenolpyruvoylglucosamine reductase
VRAAKPGDLILTMGAGDICQVARQVAEALSTRGPNLVRPARATQHIAAELGRLLSKSSKVLVAEPMARHTSLRVGGPAQFWVEPWDEQDLVALLQYCHKHELAVTVVGRGTNLLVRDGGIAGVTIHLGSTEFARVAVAGEHLVAHGGARLKTIVATARQHELGGLEFMEGIPGSLGGALRMNAGAMGQQTFGVLASVRYVNLAGQVYEAQAETLPVAYRCCPTFATHIALSAILRGQRATKSSIDEKLHAFSQRRWQTQPKQPSAGCVFKNPPSIPAGRLIEELWLKGTTVGAARVSDVHANFIVNDGGATAADVLRLIELIRDRAQQERGIELETEVMILGKQS